MSAQELLSPDASEEVKGSALDLTERRRPVGGVHVIRSDAEAIATAKELSESFRQTASARDIDRRIPIEEVEAITRSGLLGILVPREYGGPGASSVTLVKVLQTLSAADGSLGQIHQNHFNFTYLLIANGTDWQKQFFLREILNGKRLGNCLSESGGKHSQDLRTVLTPQGGGVYLLNGSKFYTTGAYLAHFLPVFAKLPDETLVFAYVDRNAPGVEVFNDWEGMGQRNTLSGTARFHNVRVAEEIIVRSSHQTHHQLIHAQIMHAAIDTGIAEGAFEETRSFLRSHARPWAGSGVERAGDDPHVIKRFGELAVQLRASETLLIDAAHKLDEALEDVSNEEKAVEAWTAVAAARAQSDHASILITNELFALCGTRSAAEKWNLHRFWRNARTHTLHDPARWKLHHLGNYHLNGVVPPLFS